MEHWDEKRVMISLVILGVCDALRDKAITIQVAERLVFSPYMMRYCADCGGEIVQAIHIGTELDDISDLVPDHFPDAVNTIRQLAITCLKSQILSEDFSDKRWTDFLEAT